MSNDLSHYGTPRHSGRYKYGSGEDPQRSKSFLSYVDELKKQGISDAEIAKGYGMTIEQLRAKRTVEIAEKRKEDYDVARKLKDKGYSNVAIGKHMGGINESSVRSLLKETIQKRSEITDTIANILKDNIDKKKYIDVGVGIERHLGITRTKLKAALFKLEEEGYKRHYIDIEQINTGKKTRTLVLTKDDVTYTELYKNRYDIKMVMDYSEDGGRSFLGLEPIKNVDSKRIKINYFEDGGKDKDGVIELRQGVEDLSLGDKRYAQVRIGVDGSHYLKGMAMYGSDMPKGIDIIYNTNKKIGTPKEKVFKPMEADKEGNILHENPFGATVRQKHYLDKDGKKQLSSLNIVGSSAKEGSGEEGAWSGWAKAISSQVLSKQPYSLAKKQLGLVYTEKQKEYEDILKLTNSVVKKNLLKSFSDGCDSDAVHLKAAAMPRQMSHIILPLKNIKETEIYAPNYNNGEKVVLIRHPHGGIFEIPELVVNNKNREGIKLLGGVEDAVGIHPKVADVLSGADFDGDTVLVIPNPAKGGIKTSGPLEGLKDFDPREEYKYVEGMSVMGTKGGGLTGQKMGDISNLITDMTIKGANKDEICRAVKHSMVVIDAENHKLNYKQSYINNGIASLKARYQGGATRGASTLISKASSDIRVPYRTEGIKTTVNGKDRTQYIDPKTGEKLYTYTNESYVNKKGKITQRTITSTKMQEEKDAFNLSSGTPIEAVYATHANQLKALANQARKDYLTTEKFYYSPSAKVAYANEVNSLNAKLNIALKNAPLERHAQLIANSVTSAKKLSNPELKNDKKELKKIGNQALVEARTRLASGKTKIDITDREWEAIQAHALSESLLSKILDSTDPERIKSLATPRVMKTLTNAQIAKAKRLIATGNTRAEIAESMGISVNTLSKFID